MARQSDNGHQAADEPVYVDDDHRAISEFAANYLDDDERETFVDHLMERHGYQRISGWGPRQDPDPPAPDPDPPAPGRPSSSAGGRGGGRGGKPAYFKR